MATPTSVSRARRSRGVLLLATTVLALAGVTAPASAQPRPLEDVGPAAVVTDVQDSAGQVTAALVDTSPLVSSPVASVVRPEPVGPRWEVMGARALATLKGYGVDPAALGYTVDFEPGRGGIRGMTYPDRHLIVIYVRDSHDDYDVLRTVAHEIGHAVSETCLDGAERRAYTQQRGLGAGWYPSSLSGFSGTEDHAEVFALSTLGSMPDFRGYSAAAPSPEALASMRAQHLLGC